MKCEAGKWREVVYLHNLTVMSSFLLSQIFERILFIWAIRHPASGYVQGINDLVTPFFVVFLSEYVGKKHEYQVGQAVVLSYLQSVCFPERSQQACLAEKGQCLERAKPVLTTQKPGILSLAVITNLTQKDLLCHKNDRIGMLCSARNR